MAVKIRLSRIGRKHAPYYRIVAVDSRRKRDGAILQELGTYDPIQGKLIQFHDAQISEWISKGAILTDSVKRLQKIYKRQPA